jgi:hypothetical protein
MSDELERKEEGGAETVHAPAPTHEATGEPLSAADYNARLEAIGRGPAKKALDWLGKMMPKGVSDGVKLPALSLLDPTKAASYQSFQEKSEFAESRSLLAQRLDAWVRAIEAAEDLDDIHDKATERVDMLSELLDKNLAEAYELIRPLEKTYRAVNGFFLNAQVEPGQAVDAYFYNAAADQLLDTDDPTLFEDLAEKIREEYKFFSLKNVYSNMVIPAWPGGVPQIDRLGKLGETYKMQIYCDTEDYETYDELLDNMDLYEGLRASVSEKQYVVLAGNHLMSRDQHSFEDDPLYVSPAAHIAGLVYQLDETMGTQEAAAGYVKGSLQGPLKARFRLDRDKVGKLKDLGIVPAADWDSKVRCMGDWNLSSQEGLDTYSRIRTEDWVVKNVCHYLNKQVFKNITPKLLSAIQRDLRKFLNDIVGDDKALDSFEVDVRATEEQKARHEVDVRMVLGFKQSVHSFNVKVTEDSAGNTAVSAEKE